MTRTYRRIGTVVVFMALYGCASAEMRQANRIREESLRWGEQLTEARRVNDNWSADCTTDVISGSRRCFAATFGRTTGLASVSYPFQVHYVNDLGPFLLVGFHTYPGERPLVRVDGDEAVVIDDDGGVTAPGRHPELVERLRSASVIRARFHTWPNAAPTDMMVDGTGFDEAWRRLQELRAGAVAPSDTIARPGGPR